MGWRKGITKQLKDLGFTVERKGCNEVWRKDGSRISLPASTKISPRTERQVMVQLKRIRQGLTVEGRAYRGVT